MEQLLKKTERNSNFEILRIIAMLMIVCHHYVVHGTTPIFSDTMTTNNILLNILGSFGKVGVGLFVMITGYFSCNKPFNLKRIILIVLELTFYAIIIYTILAIKNKNFNITIFLQKFVPLIFQTHWFITYYVLLYILSPILNKGIMNIKKQHLLAIIIFFVCLFAVVPLIFATNTIGTEYLAYFILYYLIGAYIKLYINKDSYSKNKIITILFGSIFIYIALIIIGSLTYKNSDYMTRLLNNFFYCNISIGTITISAFAIMFCQKTKPFTNKGINIISGTTLGIYIIHDYEDMRPFLWQELFNNNKYVSGNTFYFILHLLISVLIVFICCVIIDLIRKYLIEKYISKLYDLIKKKIIKE